MTHIDLGNPEPRLVERPVSQMQFATKQRRYLPIPVQFPRVCLWDVLRSRTSRRGLKPISLDVLSLVLWFTAKTRWRRTEASGFEWQHKTTPSGGGRHPLELLIFANPQEPRVSLYDPKAHALIDLEVRESEAVEHVIAKASQITANAGGLLILFAADFERTMSKYEHGESLVWRDSGALLSTFYFVCEGLGLGCCGVGMTGEPWVSALLGNAENVRGVGGCVIGDCAS